MALWCLSNYLITVFHVEVDIFGGNSHIYDAPIPSIILLALFTTPFCIRRLHDINLSGWWIVLCHPLVNFVAFLMLTMMPGTQNTNRYGVPPSPASRNVTGLAIVLLPVSAITSTLTCIYNAMFLIRIYRILEHDMLWSM